MYVIIMNMPNDKKSRKKYARLVCKFDASVGSTNVPPPTTDVSVQIERSFYRPGYEEANHSVDPLLAILQEYGKDLVIWLERKVKYLVLLIKRFYLPREDVCAHCRVWF